MLNRLKSIIASTVLIISSVLNIYSCNCCKCCKSKNIDTPEDSNNNQDPDSGNPDPGTGKPNPDEGKTSGVPSSPSGLGKDGGPEDGKGKTTDDKGKGGGPDKTEIEKKKKAEEDKKKADEIKKKEEEDKDKARRKIAVDLISNYINGDKYANRAKDASGFTVYVDSSSNVRIAFKGGNYFMAISEVTYNDVLFNYTKLATLMFKITIKSYNGDNFNFKEGYDKITLEQLVSSLKKIDTDFGGRANPQSHYLCIKADGINNSNNVYLDILNGVMYRIYHCTNFGELYVFSALDINKDDKLLNASSFESYMRDNDVKKYSVNGSNFLKVFNYKKEIEAITQDDFFKINNNIKSGYLNDYEFIIVS